MAQYHVYTDGACSGNPGPGGWAAVILDHSQKVIREICGYFPQTTNNRMEIWSALAGLRAVLEIDSRPEVCLYSDSSYLIDTYTKGWMKSWLRNGWKKGSVKNQDLWLELNALLTKVHINWIKVKGHSDNFYNNRCDQLAVAQIKQHNVYSAPTAADTTGSLPVAAEGEQFAPVEQIKTPPVDPISLNNPHSSKPSENRCLVSLAELQENLAKIRQVAERNSYQELKKQLHPSTLSSISSSVAYATFSHPTHKVHPFFLQVGQMADLWLKTNSLRPQPHPAPTRSQLVKFVCAFIMANGLEQARRNGL